MKSIRELNILVGNLLDIGNTATSNVENVKTRGTPRWEVQLQAGCEKLRLAEPTTNAFTPKLSNGTIPKGIAKDTKDTREGKDAEKQQACPEETKLLKIAKDRERSDGAISMFLISLKATRG
ncbi:hypothetical protein E2986_11618 [Frieseomelitta varia]|uniref:Uncharacterized protein n=1 Tax=Frieseomelitta varia TaxID=561572 RepID=A0A833W896_9HYME|nr:hypothetical protein E2986_11618 [Frieseomelitta varia]